MHPRIIWFGFGFGFGYDLVDVCVVPTLHCTFVSVHLGYIWSLHLPCTIWYNICLIIGSIHISCLGICFELVGISLLFFDSYLLCLLWHMITCFLISSNCHDLMTFLFSRFWWFLFTYLFMLVIRLVISIYWGF